MAKLIKRIPLVPPKTTPKFDKLADTVTRSNPKVYDGKFDSIELEEWIRGMEKVFAIVEVPEGKKGNIRTFYLTSKTDI